MCVAGYGEYRPIVANGAVYVTDGSAHLLRFAIAGLNPTTTAVTSSLTPSTFGGFWMTIEGVNQRVRVTPFGVGR